MRCLACYLDASPALISSLAHWGLTVFIPNVRIRLLTLALVFSALMWPGDVQPPAVETIKPNPSVHIILFDGRIVEARLEGGMWRSQCKVFMDTTNPFKVPVGKVIGFLEAAQKSVTRVFESETDIRVQAVLKTLIEQYDAKQAKIDKVIAELDALKPGHGLVWAGIPFTFSRNPYANTGDFESTSSPEARAFFLKIQDQRRAAGNTAIQIANCENHLSHASKLKLAPISGGKALAGISPQNNPGNIRFPDIDQVPYFQPPTKNLVQGYLSGIAKLRPLIEHAATRAALSDAFGEPNIGIPPNASNSSILNRSASWKILGLMAQNNPNVTQTLLYYLGTSTDAFSWGAMEALIVAGEPALSPMLGMLNDDETPIHVFGCLVGSICCVADFPNDIIEQNLVRAISRMKKDRVPAMGRLFSADADAVRKFTDASAADYCGGAFTPDEILCALRLSKLVQTHLPVDICVKYSCSYLNSPNEHLLVEAIMTLGAVGCDIPECVDRMLPFASDPRPRVRAAFANAAHYVIIENPSRRNEMLTLLLQMASKDPDQHAREDALRISGQFSDLSKLKAAIGPCLSWQDVKILLKAASNAGKR